jgi:hypothetical protein
MIDSHWIVRKRAKGTDTFTTADDFVADGAAPTSSTSAPYANIPHAITVVAGNLPSAGIYVVGEAQETVRQDTQGKPVFKTYWIVRKSTDGGSTWSTVDDFPGDTSPDFVKSIASRVCADRAGNVYVVGGVKVQRPASLHWIVRKSATGARYSWSTDDDYVLSSEVHYGKAISAATDLAGNVYVVGCTDDVGTSNHLQERGIIRSNAGGSWHTVGSFRPDSGGAFFTSVTVDAHGRVYAGGWSQSAGRLPVWIVRTYGPAETAPATPGKNLREAANAVLVAIPVVRTEESEYVNGHASLRNDLARLDDATHFVLIEYETLAAPSAKSRDAFASALHKVIARTQSIADRDSETQEAKDKSVRLKAKFEEISNRLTP